MARTGFTSGIIDRVLNQPFALLLGGYASLLTCAPAIEELVRDEHLDDGLWREYRDALGAARIHRNELREAMASRIEAARAAHGQRFKVRHHAIATMPGTAQTTRVTKRRSMAGAFSAQPGDVKLNCAEWVGDTRCPEGQAPPCFQCVSQH